MVRQVDIKALVSHIVRGDGADKCRICMGDTSEGQVYLGDTVMVDGDKPVTLAELLESITGVEVNEETLCPLGACVACASAAIAAQELRSLVIRSQKSWNSVVASLSEIPGEVKPSVKSIYGLLKRDNISFQFINNCISDDPKTTLDRLKNHITRKKQNPTERKPRVQRTGPACFCPDCNKSFISPFYLNLHLKNSGQKDACTICGLVVTRGQGMMEHMSSVHGKTLTICDECPMLFSNDTDLKTHKKKAHKPGAMTCGDCGRTFLRSGSFEAHSQMHTVRTCRACGAQFANRGCYREHRAQCEPDAKPDIQNMPRNRRSNVRDPATFTCDYCGKTYHSRPQLKNHIIWIHMDVRTHQCSWCGKRFYTSARLTEHTIVHTRERKFECDICGLKLVSKMAAVYHRRRHTGERPYQCDDCGDKFISASRRSEHAKRRHGKGLKIACAQCPAMFIRTLELRKHIEKIHKPAEPPEPPLLVRVKRIKSEDM